MSQSQRSKFVTHDGYPKQGCRRKRTVQYPVDKVFIFLEENLSVGKQPMGREGQTGFW